jgi:hypothetical protein
MCQTYVNTAKCRTVWRMTIIPYGHIWYIGQNDKQYKTLVSRQPSKWTSVDERLRLPASHCFGFRIPPGTLNDFMWETFPAGSDSVCCSHWGAIWSLSSTVKLVLHHKTITVSMGCIITKQQQQKSCNNNS